MTIAVFGANGKVGRQVVAEALARGHTVRAFCHRNSQLPEHPNLIICRGDIYDPTTVQTAVDGADAVISSLGSWGTKRKDVVSSGMRAIIPAMRIQKVTRIISLTGSDARAPGDSLGLLHRLTYSLLRLFAGNIVADGELHIELLAVSSLDWTVLRSPPMLPFGSADRLKLGYRRPLPWQTIPRAAVATALLDLLETSKYAHRAPYISRGH